MARFAHSMDAWILPFDAAAGAEAAARFADLGIVEFLTLVAGGSPYLKGLMLREEAFLRGALALDVDAVVAAEIALVADLPLEALATGLRQAKRRVALWTGLCDLGGVWDLAQVTRAMTVLADAAVAVCLQRLVEDEVRRGKLPGGDAGHAGGMEVLAMGKMGAGELNYSSDIDLICLYDETRYAGAEQEARASFIRVTRKMTALLSDATAEGYVFRVDLRLRPDASVTPVCISMGAAEAYSRPGKPEHAHILCTEDAQ